MNQRLKKLIGWLTTTILLTSIVGCSSKESPLNTSPSTRNDSEIISNQPSQETVLASPLLLPKTTYGIGKPISVKDKNLNLEFTVNSIREHQGKGVIKPNQGQKWILVNTKILNKGQKPQIISVVSFGLIDGKNHQYEVALLAGALDDVESATGQINPGKEIQGEVAFEVPKKAKKLKLIFKPNSINCEVPASKENISKDLNCKPIVVKVD